MDMLGGNFWFARYEPSDTQGDSGREVGAYLELYFTPGALVEASAIGIVQTVATWKSTRAGAPPDVVSFVSGHKQSLATAAGDGAAGYAIDQEDRASDGWTPNTNPVYADENGAIAGGPRVISATLVDERPDPSKGYGGLGSRTARDDGGYDVVDAALRDHPVRALELDGQAWLQRFEAAALVLDGPMANLWLGSVEWGWRFDGTTAVVEPAAPRLVSVAAPSAVYFAAARRWNAGVSVWDWAHARRYPNVKSRSRRSPSVTLCRGALRRGAGDAARRGRGRDRVGRGGDGGRGSAEPRPRVARARRGGRGARRCGRGERRMTGNHPRATAPCLIGHKSWNSTSPAVASKAAAATARSSATLCAPRASSDRSRRSRSRDITMATSS